MAFRRVVHPVSNGTIAAGTAAVAAGVVGMVTKGNVQLADLSVLTAAFAVSTSRAVFVAFRGSSNQSEIEERNRIFVFQLAYDEPPLAVGERGLVVADNSRVALDEALSRARKGYYPLLFAEVYEAAINVNGFTVSSSSRIGHVDGRIDKLIFLGMGELAAKWSSPGWLARDTARVSVSGLGGTTISKPVVTAMEPLIEVFR